MACKQDDDQKIIDQLCKKLNNLQMQFRTADLKHKTNVLGSELIKFLKNYPEAITAYEDMSNLTEGLATNWIIAPNPTVALYGLDSLMIIADTLKARYKPYTSIVMAQCISRLSDVKGNLREKARLYFIKTVEVGAQNPESMFEKMSTLFSSRSTSVVPEAQKVISGVYQVVLSQNLKLSNEGISKLIRIAIKGMTLHGRAEAEAILTDLSKSAHSGLVLIELEKIPKEKQKSMLGKKLMLIMERLMAERLKLQEQQVANMRIKNPLPKKNELEQLPEKSKKAPAAEKSKPLKGSSQPSYEDPGPSCSYVTTPDNEEATSKRLDLENKDKPTKKTKGFLKSVRPYRVSEAVTYALHSGLQGEADEAWFESAFTDVAPVVCLNRKEFDKLMQKIIGDLKSDTWEKIVDALKKLRSIKLHLPHYEEDLVQMIKDNYLLFLNGLKDKRSQVLRETCLTYSFFCKELKNKLDPHSCEMILIQLLFNSMNSAKVIASASNITLRFMFTHINHSSLMVILEKEMTYSKSLEVHKVSFELLELLLSKWPKYRLRQNLSNLAKFIKTGLSENSTDGRNAARRAFLKFWTDFPEQGEALLKSLDDFKRKKIEAFFKQHLKENQTKQEKEECSSKHRGKQPTSRTANIASPDSKWFASSKDQDGNTGKGKYPPLGYQEMSGDTSLHSKWFASSKDQDGNTGKGKYPPLGYQEMSGDTSLHSKWFASSKDQDGNTGKGKYPPLGYQEMSGDTSLRKSRSRSQSSLSNIPFYAPQSDVQTPLSNIPFFVAQSDVQTLPRNFRNYDRQFSHKTGTTCTEETGMASGWSDHPCLQAYDDSDAFSVAAASFVQSRVHRDSSSSTIYSTISRASSPSLQPTLRERSQDSLSTEDMYYKTDTKKEGKWSYGKPADLEVKPSMLDRITERVAYRLGFHGHKGKRSKHERSDRRFEERRLTETKHQGECRLSETRRHEEFSRRETRLHQKQDQHFEEAHVSDIEEEKEERHLYSRQFKMKDNEEAITTGSVSRSRFRGLGSKLSVIWNRPSNKEKQTTKHLTLLETEPEKPKMVDKEVQVNIIPDRSTLVQEAATQTFSTQFLSNFYYSDC